jgi:hypothetical protein
MGYGAEPVSEKEKEKEKQNQRNKSFSLFLFLSDISRELSSIKLTRACALPACYPARQKRS